MRNLILLVLLSLLSCKKETRYEQTTNVTTPVFSESATHNLAPEQSYLYEVNLWWGTPSLYGVDFPMGTSVAAFAFDDQTTTAPFIQVELVAWSGHWWELGTDWVDLCADSFYVCTPSGNDIEVIGEDLHGMWKIVHLGDTVTFEAITDSAVFQINKVKILDL